MRIILFGPPGSGKGTQAELIQTKLGIPHISSGDMFRNAVTNGTELGREAVTYMNRGSLVPDELVIGMIMERIAKSDALDGFLLDGFPRTLPQAEVLNEALVKSNNELEAVLVLEVPDDMIIERTTGRRIDPHTGKTYHIKFNLPPENIAERLIQRDDDSEMIVRKRLAKYRADTSKVLPYYESQGLVRKISGLGKVEDVREKVAGELNLS